MLTQQSKGCELSSGKGKQQATLSRKEQRPVTFMFIDSSNGGVNAKPDRVVRSFVMKAARNKKPWSTRPKSPRTEASCSERPRRRSTSQIQGNHSHPHTIDRPFSSGFYSHMAPWETDSTTSSSSSKSNSTISSRSNSWTSRSPVLADFSPGVDFVSLEDEHNTCKQRQPALAPVANFDIILPQSFDCLAVRLNKDSERLLHQSELVPFKQYANAQIITVIEASTPRLLPIDPHKSFHARAVDWFTTCIQSPIGAPFIYAALASSARAAKLDTEHYKWRAIAEVNRLLTDPSKNTDNTTIATVMMLLAFESTLR